MTHLRGIPGGDEESVPSAEKNDILIMPLSDVLDKEEATEERISSTLGSFSCRDRDVEQFLHKDAVRYERSRKAGTYLLVRTGATPSLCGYFSLALTCVEIETLSKSQRKRLYGLFDPRVPIACYLIGQLGRSSKIERTVLPGDLILEQAIGIIKIAQERVAGRFVLVECMPEPTLLDFYKSNGLNVLSRDDHLCQLFRMLD